MAVTYTNIVKKIVKELEQQGKEVVMMEPQPWYVRPRAYGRIPFGRVSKNGTTWYATEPPTKNENAFVIECSKVEDPMTLATFLHEVGHIVHNDCEQHKIKHRSLFGQVGNRHVIRQETEASRYALRRMREFGIPTEEAAIGLTAALQSYGGKTKLRP